jgi:adenylosuccinate lyase
MALGLKNVSAEAVQQMVEQKENIDWTRLRSTEKRLKHDIMAHIEVYGEACPRARGVIHLGATSCYVQDNADLLVQHEALTHIILRLAVCLKRLGEFAQRHADWVTPGRTHYQEASMTTVGKRACIWAQELLMVLNSVCCWSYGSR